MTDVIQRAIDDSQGLFRCRTIYFPNGTYNVSDTLAIYKVAGSGKAQGRHCMTWQGESEDGVIIELADNADGFDDPGVPKPVISTLECNGCGTNTNFGISLADTTDETLQADYTRDFLYRAVQPPGGDRHRHVGLLGRAALAARRSAVARGLDPQAERAGLDEPRAPRLVDGRTGPHPRLSFA